MKEYLAIVLRNHFNLIYRFGYGTISSHQTIPFDGVFDEPLNAKLLSCISTLTPFEYDEEYLILHISSSMINERSLEISPEDIKAIYPLSNQAKISIESKIDSRIRLEEPKFNEVVEKAKDAFLVRSIERSIDIVYKIVNIDNYQIDILPITEILNGLHKRKLGAKAQTTSSGTFWETLIAYDRYDYFPNTVLGYLYDVGNVFSYYKGKSDGVVGTKLHQFLEKLNANDPKIRLNDIIENIEKDELTIKFIEESNAIAKGKFRSFLAAILFLIWKEELRSSEKSLMNSSVFHNGKISFYNEHPQEVKVALFLLASFFGFNRFYDEYYSIANLKFFKGYRELQPSAELKTNGEENTQMLSESEINSNSVAEPNQSENPTEKNASATPEQQENKQKVKKGSKAKKSPNQDSQSKLEL